MTNRIAALGAAVLLAIPALAFQVAKADPKASIAGGKEVYNSQCVTCHGPVGAGIKDVYPPLAKSDFLNADKSRAIKIVLHGQTGKIKVNGVEYDSEMMSFELTDEQISDVLNYVRNSWGNKGIPITAAEVAAVRKQPK